MLNKFRALLFILSWLFLLMTQLPAEEVQKVYEYQNSQGVTEFTDTIKADKEPVQQLKIEKRSAAEEAQSQEKLQQIREKDRELDKKINSRRQMEYKRSTRQRSEQQTQKSDDDDVDIYYRRRLPYARPPHRPIKPKPRPAR